MNDATTFADAFGFIDCCQTQGGLEPGALIEDQRQDRYLVIRPQPDAHLDHGTVLRLSDSTLLHPSWMEFPVRLVAVSLDQFFNDKIESLRVRA